MDRKVHGVCWASITPDILIHIFSKLDHDSLLSAARVCCAWCLVSSHPECWDFVHSSKHDRFLDNNIKETGIPNHERLVEQSVYIFRYAGVRAKSISVHPEADDTMLQKIADRCPSIESISLRDCKYISAAAIAYLAHACKHLKLIDLNLTGAKNLKSSDLWYGIDSAVTMIEEIGRSCPGLVGINLNGWRVTREMATTIGTFMPKLKWLSLNKANLHSTILCRILDSCTELEYVSVEQCRRLRKHPALTHRVGTILEFKYTPRMFPRSFLSRRAYPPNV